MTQTFLLSVVTLTLLGTNVHAQDGAAIQQQARCWLANEGYSSGATIRSGETVMECQPDFSWQTTTKNAGGCLHNDAYFSTGAYILTGWADNHVRQKCNLDGTWTIEN